VLCGPANHSAAGAIQDPAKTRESGSALLSVLWLAAALAAVSFSLSNTVRSETERAATAVEGTRAYYVAAGAVQRAYMEVLWEYQSPNPAKPLFTKPVVTLDYEFPEGLAHVEVIPESSMLEINKASPEELIRLCMALGMEAGGARQVAMAIDDWRRPGGQSSPFDAYYQSLTPSFLPSHTSFQEIEELLLVKGVTPELFYGTYVPGPDRPGAPRLVRREGLVDCLSALPGDGRIDANSAPPAVLAAIGMTPSSIEALIAQRRVKPFDGATLSAFLSAVGAPPTRLRVEGNSVVNFRATARPRLPNGGFGDLKRSVAAQIKYMPQGFDSLVHILRWRDTAWSD
jgi:general secretion pathway protein K